MKFRPVARKPHVDTRKPEVEFRSLGLSFAMQSNGEIQITGALGHEFPPDAVLAGASSPACCLPSGHGQRARPDQDAFPGLGEQPRRPDSADGRVAGLAFASRFPAGADSKTRPTLDAN